MLTGSQTDILALAGTEWYKWVYYRDSNDTFSYPSERLRRCLGPYEHKGTVMSHYVLNDQRNLLLYQKFQRLTKLDQNSPVEALKRERFYKIVFNMLEDSLVPPPTSDSSR